MTHFFDRFPRFLQSSTTGAWRDRLICRYESIIAANRERIHNARVLDIACHDARWAAAALDAGAQSVTGVEIREELVEASNENLAAIGAPPERYSVHLADIFNASDIWQKEYDVIFCLGFFYHTARHEQLFNLMSGAGASLIILDTCITPLDGSFCEWKIENVAPQAAGHSISGVCNNKILVGHPSRDAIRLMAKHFGYDLSEFEWMPLLNQQDIAHDPNSRQSAENPLRDYAANRRSTFYATKN